MVRAYLSVSDGHLEQLLEILIAFLILVTGLTPLCYRLSVEDEDVEECIEKQDHIGLDRDTVKKDWLGRRVKCIGHESRLNHD